MAAFSAIGGLSLSMANLTRTLRAQQDAMDTVTRNVANISTPGYAREVPVVHVDAVGMVSDSGPVTRRNLLLDDEVRSRNQAAAGAAQERILADRVEGLLPIGNGSIADQIDTFFNSFSELAVNPNRESSRQNVLTQAERLAAQFRSTASRLNQESARTDTEIRNAVDEVNRLAGQVVVLNRQSRSLGLGKDGQVDAQRTHLLEQLSSYVDVSAIPGPEGALTVFLANGEPLILEDTAYPVQASFTSSEARILDHRGIDIGPNLSGGKLTALLAHRNEKLPDVLDGLNQLAEGLSSTVNATWNAGWDQSGATPTSALFTFTAGQQAGTLRLNSLTAGDVPAAAAGAAGGNGNALALSNLRNAAVVGTAVPSEAYAGLAARLGRDLANARDEEAFQQSLLEQARQVRDRVSAVSLDEEAAEMVRLQTAYEASARMMRTLDEMSETLINMLR